MNIILYCHVLIKASNERLSNKELDTTDGKTCYYYTERGRIMGIVILLVKFCDETTFACLHALT